MVLCGVEFFRLAHEFLDVITIIYELRHLRQWNAHIFEKEIVQRFVGRVSPAEQLLDVVISPCFAFDNPWSVLDHLQDYLLVVNCLGQVVDAAVLFFLERIFFVNCYQGRDELASRRTLALGRRFLQEKN